MGSDPIAVPTLEGLHAGAVEGCRLTAVFTQPDRPRGRGQRTQPNAIKQWALEKGLPVRQPVRCGEEDAAWLRAEGVDLGLVMAFGQILPRIVLEAFTGGCFNLHASLLPRLRGASPIHTAIALGLKETGVSFMRMTTRLDAGAVADVETVPILPDATAPDLHALLAEASRPLAERCLRCLLAGNLTFEEQEASAVTYCRIIEKTDAHLDFRVPAPVLVDRVRAFTPWPGTRFPHDGQEIRVRRADGGPDADGLDPGSVFKAPSGDLCIACGSGSLRPLELQRPGGKPMEAEAFFRGFTLPEGTRLASRSMAPLESPVPFPYRKRPKST